MKIIYDQETEMCHFDTKPNKKFSKEFLYNATKDVKPEKLLETFINFYEDNYKCIEFSSLDMIEQIKQIPKLQFPKPEDLYVESKVNDLIYKIAIKLKNREYIAIRSRSVLEYIITFQYLPGYTPDELDTVISEIKSLGYGKVYINYKDDCSSLKVIIKTKTTKNVKTPTK